MKKKKFKSILNLNKSVISKIGNSNLTGGQTTTGLNMSLVPDQQSVCLCGAPPTVLENTCRDESQCVGSCYRTCSLDEGVPPDNF